MPNLNGPPIAKAVFKSLCCFSLIATAALSFSGCASAKKQDEAQLHARIGTALLTQGHYPEALRELLNAEKLDPSSAPIQNNLGLAYFMREKPALAAEHLERAVFLDKTYSEARNNYGRVLIELGKYDEAVKQLQLVIDDLTYPDPAKALVNMGLAHFRRGRFPEARTQFSKAITISRENCLAQTYYGRSLFELAQFQAAAQALDNATIVCHAGNGRDFDEAQYYGGLAYYKLGKTSAAVSRMEDVMKDAPEGRYAKKAESLLKLMK